MTSYHTVKKDNSINLYVTATTYLKIHTSDYTYIDCYVCDSLDAVEMDYKDALRLIKKLIKAFKEYVGTLPSNTLLCCCANEGDGKGPSRIKLFKRLGFESIAEDGEYDPCLYYFLDQSNKNVDSYCDKSKSMTDREFISLFN
jgi:hypothetical protein